MSTNVKGFTEIISEPKDKTFFSLHFLGEKATRQIGIAAQTVSGITEFHAVFILAGGDYQNLKSLATLSAIALGLVVVFFFEIVGVRIYLVRIIRQITKKELKTLPAKLLFAFNATFATVLIVANFALSILGQKMTTHDKVNVTTHDQTAPIDSVLFDQTTAIRQAYKVSRTDLEIALNKAIKDVEKQTVSTVNELKNSRFASRENKAAYNSYTKQIDTELANKTATIAQLRQDYKTALQDLKTAENDELKLLTTAASTRKNGIAASVGTSVNFWKFLDSLILPLLVAFMCLGIFAVCYTEIFYKGSDVDITAIPKQKKPNIFKIFFVGIYERLYKWSYKKTEPLNVVYTYGNGLPTVIPYGMQSGTARTQPLRTTGTPQFRPAFNNVSGTNATPSQLLTMTAHGIRNLYHTRQAQQNQTPGTAQPQGTNNGTAQPNQTPAAPLNVQSNTLNVAPNQTPAAQTQGTQNGNGKTCLHCQKTFFAKHWNAKYCTDKCRIDAWQAKTGQTLKKGKKAPAKP